MMIPGCQCERCQNEWVADLITYALRLETAALAVRDRLRARDNETAADIITEAAKLAAARDLVGEVQREEAAAEAAAAVAERAAGRLH
jgi:hypothetical protein